MAKGEGPKPLIQQHLLVGWTGDSSAPGVELTSLSGAEEEGRTMPLDALWRKGKGHSEECIVPGRHHGTSPIPQPTADWEKQKQSSGVRKNNPLPIPVKPEPQPSTWLRMGLQDSAKSRNN